MTLFVPRKSIGLYRQARGWNSFFAIEPIEPPIVAGLNDATITWVTNANVSYYTLTLYLDESKTIRLLTLTFDNRGYLQNMDINPDAYSSPYSAPQRSINTLDDDEEDINGYQSSMNFTKTGLRQGTTYYFVRQTHNALNEVIDEESGLFTMLSGTTTDIDDAMIKRRDDSVFSSQSLLMKLMCNGTIYLLGSDGKVYNVD
ncbi:MAG: hypothetical protein IJS00_07515 [Paludibacteraceae bacterium]|nr:hypothetical protein [Paludibacteraceae bacterium]